MKALGHAVHVVVGEGLEGPQGPGEVWRVRPGTGVELASDPSPGTSIRRFLKVS